MKIQNDLTNANLLDLYGYSNIGGNVGSITSYIPTQGSMIPVNSTVVSRPIPSGTSTGTATQSPSNIPAPSMSTTPVGQPAPAGELGTRMEQPASVGYGGGGGGGSAPTEASQGGGEELSFYEQHKTKIWIGGALLLVGIWYAKKKGLIKFGKA